MGMATEIEPVRAALKECGWGILKEITSTPARRVTVRVGNRLAVVQIVLMSRTEADGQATATQQFPGLPFSPIEAAVWNALSGGPLNAKSLARTCGQKYTPKIRI